MRQTIAGVGNRIGRASRRGFVVCVAVCLCAGASPAMAAAKTDVVELANGDRITCEIQKLERGKLVVKTDGVGTVSIEWDDVNRLTSAASYEIELVSGDRLFGSLSRGDPRTVDLVAASGTERLPLATIVRISPLGRTFWKRLDGSVDAGFNFSEANVQTQWTFHTSVNYRARLWTSTLTADSSLTTQEDADSQVRNTVSLQTLRSLHPRWSAVGFAQAQQNEELSLDLRGVLGAGLVRVFKHSNRTLLTAIGAAAFTREQFAESDEENVAEAVAGITWAWFKFDGRSPNLGTDVLSFYALNRDARVRLELNANLKSDIVSDLYWTVNLFESYNSDPPEGQKRNDFGISASIGWSF